MFKGECELMSVSFTIRQSLEDLNGQAMGLLLVFEVACVNVGQRECRTPGNKCQYGKKPQEKYTIKTWLQKQRGGYQPRTTLRTAF